jgi:hypothetical protein
MAKKRVPSSLNFLQIFILKGRIVEILRTNIQKAGRRSTQKLKQGRTLKSRTNMLKKGRLVTLVYSNIEGNVSEQRRRVSYATDETTPHIRFCVWVGHSS